MGLLQNGFAHSLTGKFYGATKIDGVCPSNQVYWGHRAAANRNSLMGAGITDAKASVPNGMVHPNAWIMPNVAGGMSAGIYDFSLSTSANGVMGLPTSGSASFSIDVADATGELIAFGIGSSTFSVTTNTPDLTASVDGVGSASMSIAVADALLGALAGGVGSATMTISGSLTPYAIGMMEGTTDVDTGVPTSDQNAAAVWAKILSNSQTAEDTLLAAGSAGDPWITPLPGSYADGTAGAIIATIQSILRNRTKTDPLTGQMTVYADDGVTPLMTANLWEDTAGTTPYRGKGAELRERLE